MDLKGRVIEVRMFGGLETFTEEDGAYYNSVKETDCLLYTSIKREDSKSLMTGQHDGFSINIIER